MGFSSFGFFFLKYRWSVHSYTLVWTSELKSPEHLIWIEFNQLIWTLVLWSRFESRVVGPLTCHTNRPTHISCHGFYKRKHDQKWWQRSRRGLHPDHLHSVHPSVIPARLRGHLSSSTDSFLRGLNSGWGYSRIRWQGNHCPTAPLNLCLLGLHPRDLIRKRPLPPRKYWQRQAHHNHDSRLLMPAVQTKSNTAQGCGQIFVSRLRRGSG